LEGVVDVSKLDRVGPWSEIKLEIIKRYALEYSKILTSQIRPTFSHIYVDAFAGAGQHVSRRTEELVPGSPMIALGTDPPFRQYHFIDLDQVRVERLEALAGERRDMFVHHGDCNEIVIRDVLPQLRYEDYRRGLCLLDPYGLHLNWETIRAIGHARTTEVFLNFPIMDMNRNALLKDPTSRSPRDEDRMNAFWGDDSWQAAFYAPRPQLSLFGDQADEKTVTNAGVAEAFRQRLLKEASFAHVLPPLAMKNTAERTLYYLFFASHNPVARKIVEHIFDKFR